MKQRTAEIQAITSVAIARLAAIRKDRGLSLRKLSMMAGVTQPGLMLVERGDRKPTLHYLLQLCKALEIDLWPLIKEAEATVGYNNKI